MWAGEFGEVATMRLTDCSTGLVAVTGNGKDQVESPVEPDAVVNVGLNPAKLKGTITKDDVQRSFVVAFTGWEKLKGGRNMRLFEVMGEVEPLPEDGEQLVAELEAEDDEVPY